jgi:hypothetical protein
MYYYGKDLMNNCNKWIISKINMNWIEWIDRVVWCGLKLNFTLKKCDFANDDDVFENTEYLERKKSDFGLYEKTFTWIYGDIGM